MLSTPPPFLLPPPPPQKYTDSGEIDDTATAQNEAKVSSSEVFKNIVVALV